ncbi:hypothetical protein BOTBODRAFT_190585 [Botryobasidium botryosum FD-172 SS1]|uniref:Uncharacterized protein n=1 Tax=Botryobasidium botryosum (strain FD-172 SS1) TaxID=930990 RepID=A0A067MEF0_BOTB1|nr:hypothetical protein BOTBODRAFT_190585 [Botryobasidium botryosum FD-172 SS1]
MSSYHFTDMGAQAPTSNFATTTVAHPYSAKPHIQLAADSVLRLVRLPCSVKDSIRELIQREWPHGIVSDVMREGLHEFKLGNAPWGSQGIRSAAARAIMQVQRFLLVTSILSCVHECGWSLITQTDIKNFVFDTNMFSFEYIGNTQPSKFFAMSFVDSDAIQLINTHNKAMLAVQNAVAYDKHAVVRMYEELNAVVQFSLIDCECWNKRTLLALLESFEKNGFVFHTSFGMQGNTSGGASSTGTNPDTWVFRLPTKVPSRKLCHSLVTPSAVIPSLESWHCTDSDDPNSWQEIPRSNPPSPKLPDAKESMGWRAWVPWGSPVGF